MKSKLLTILICSVALSACVTARMHTDAELNAVGQQCGLALGELIQDESEKRLLLTVRNDPTLEQRKCVTRWARKNGLRPVFVSMQFPETGS